jgi:hypothetical protein
MRTITLNIIREPGNSPRIGVRVNNELLYAAFLRPEEVTTWVQGFIAALPEPEEQ